MTLRCCNSITIIKDACVVPIFHTRWEARVLYNNTNNHINTNTISCCWGLKEDNIETIIAQVCVYILSCSRCCNNVSTLLTTVACWEIVSLVAAGQWRGERCFCIPVFCVRLFHLWLRDSEGTRDVSVYLCFVWDCFICGCRKVKGREMFLYTCVLCPFFCWQW